MLSERLAAGTGCGQLLPGTADTKTSSEFEQALEFNRRALFVGGCPKSGTTLLLALLDGHPELATLPVETHYLEELRKHAKKPGHEVKLRAILAHLEPRQHYSEKLETIHNNSAVDPRIDFTIDFAEFTRLAGEFATRPGMNDSLLLSETVRAYMTLDGQDWQGCTYWVEKTPSNVAHADDLFRLYPDAKLIQIVRDPRAVFASRRRRLVNRYGSHTKAHRLVREWNESSRQIARLRDRAGSYLLIRYEDLVQSSRKVMKRICQFTGISFAPLLLQPTFGGRPWAGNSTFEGAFEGIESAPLDRWKSELSEDEIWWVEWHCREGMDIAGYGLVTDAKFSLSRWLKRLPGESRRGYLRARKSSLCQMAGLLSDCRYERTAAVVPDAAQYLRAAR